MGLVVGGAGGVGGSPPSSDANSLHYYLFQDAAGSATVADTGVGTTANLTIAGTENLAFKKQCTGLYLPQYGRVNTRLYDGTNSAGAFSANTAGLQPAAAAITAEAFFVPVKAPAYNGTALVVGLDDNSFNNVFWMGHISSGWQCSLKTANVDHVTTAQAPVMYGEPHHLMAVYNSADATNTLRLYLDGNQIAAANYALGNHPAFTRLTVGNYSGNAIFAADIRVGYVRVSNTARDATYAASTYATLRLM